MKIYILRHEDRTHDCTFFSPLTKIGLENSIKLIDILKKEKINTIYTSPFIRTLQTIYPYAKSNNIKLNIEYGMSEIHHEDIIAKKSVGINLPEYLAESFEYNPEYKTLIKSTDIVYPEKLHNVELRVKKVLLSVIMNNKGTDNNIILVSHQTFCITALKIVNKSNEMFKGKLTKYIENYEKGKACLIYDSNNSNNSQNYWTFRSLN